MEEEDETIKTSHIPGIKTIQENRNDLKYYHLNKPKNRIYINSVTGEEIDFGYENEEDMYEVLPDIEKYNEEKINNNTDLNEKDKFFFHMWNNFMKNKNISDDFCKILIEFLNDNQTIIFENNLKKNFLFHIMIIYENRQISENDIIQIIDTLNNLSNKYQENKMK